MSVIPARWKVAVLSDTHGLLRPEVLAHCAGADAILHAGDVGSGSILEQLQRIAPLTAIRGNIDTAGPCARLPVTEMTMLGAITIYMVHALEDLDINPVAAGVQVVVSGHSHKPKMEQRAGVLYLNPGSVGPRRFKLPVSMAMLRIVDTQISVDQLVIAT